MISFGDDLIVSHWRFNYIHSFVFFFTSSSRWLHEKRELGKKVIGSRGEMA